MKKLLHVGCGPKRKHQTTSGFASAHWRELRFDIDPNVKPDVLGSITDLSAIPSDSVDAIFSSHNIEHLYPHEVPQALAEWRRVLNQNGFVVVTCPDLQSVAALIVADKLTEPAYVSPSGPIAPLDIIYGHRAQMAKGNLFMAHRCGFTRTTLAQTLLQSGFAAAATLARPHLLDLWAVASKSVLSEAEMRVLAEEHFPQNSGTKRSQPARGAVSA